MQPMESLKALRERHRREERKLVIDVLESCGWSPSIAAKELRIAYSSLQRLIDRHGLRKRYERHAPGRGRPKLVDWE